MEPAAGTDPAAGTAGGAILPGLCVSGIAAVTWNTHHVGALAVTHAVNNLAAQGIRPAYVNCCILLPSGTQELCLREIADEIAWTAFCIGISVTDVQAEVTPALTRPLVMASAYAGREYAKPFPGGFALSSDDADRIRHETGADRDTSDDGNGLSDILPGDVILELGDIALEGTFLLAAERRKELSERFPVRFLQQASDMGKALSVLPALEELQKAGIHPKSMISVSEGGICAALWRLSGETGRGFEVSLPDIPIRQETVEITDFYGINPYQMASSGCLLAVLDPADAAKGSRTGRIIGHLIKGNGKILVNGNERQCLNRPSADALLQVMG